MGPEEMAAVFARTLDPDYEADDPWEAVCLLRLSGGRAIFDEALDWCRTGNPLQRTRGADIVAQIGVTKEHRCNEFPRESFTEMARMVRTERERLPLISAISALGHIGNPDAVLLVATHREHEDAGVRDAVAFALGCFPNDPAAVPALLGLMADSDGDVRDWATFGLGVLGDADSPKIREALLVRLGDTNPDAGEEAMAALAKRGDQRALPVVVAKLAQPELAMRVEEAAAAFLGEQGLSGWTREEIALALRRRFPGVTPAVTAKP